MFTSKIKSMKLRFILLVIFVIVAGTASFAQGKSQVITGKVVSFEESLPLEAVTIKVKDSQGITGTQADGSFTLELKPQEKILLVSLDGYETKEVAITRATDYSIVLRRKN